jgi:uncharacterized protein with HEPN domain
VIERDRLYLGHIVAAAADIEEFTADGRAGFFVVEQDEPVLRTQVFRILSAPDR